MFINLTNPLSRISKKFKSLKKSHASKKKIKRKIAKESRKKNRKK